MSIKSLIIAYHPIPLIINHIEGGKNVHSSSWIQSTVDIILNHDDIELIYLFPYSTKIIGEVAGIKYYTIEKIPELHFRDRKRYRHSDFIRFQNIINKVEPDIIHIYGTEFIFLRQFVQMLFDMNMIDKCVIWIQGIVSRVAANYCLGYTNKQKSRRTFLEFIKRTNIRDIEYRLGLNGKGETRILKMVKHVFVRTDWDAACCKAINPNISIYKCNETLRMEFYENVCWNIKTVEKYSIFLSQSVTPLKGFLQLIKALPIILRKFPNTVVYTTGENIVEMYKDLRKRFYLSSYQRIIAEELLKSDLYKRTIFLGTLSSKEMRDRFLDSHVFVSASSIENSSNAISEAMMLGVPIIASDVGGTGSLLLHKQEGMLYPFEEYMLMADYIIKIFENDELAVFLSESARKRALIVHDIEKSYKDLLYAYRTIISNKA